VFELSLISGILLRAKVSEQGIIMNKIIPNIATFAFVAGLTVSFSSYAEEEPNTVSLDGLELVEKDRRGEIYADPDVDWSVYTEIQLQDATVAFRRNWQRDQNRYNSFKIRTDDMEKIKSSLAAEFHEVFTEELSSNGGYTMTDASGDSVMTIKPAIVDLDVHAPDTMRAGRTRQFTESAGKMTLKLELYDSVTGDLIATASDRREAPRRGYMQWTTSVSNKAEASRMLKRWAQGLRERLDKARGAE
jgi:hypothetical protein